MIKFSRRTFISVIAASGAAITVPARPAAASRIGPDRVWIRRRETGEELNDCFVYQSGIAQRAAHALYSHFWRDVRDHGKMVWIDMGLLVVFSDLQLAIARKYGHEAPIELFSGYRTRKRNATLEGAAQNSQHVYGRAGDFTIPGLTPRQVADLAEDIHGVGGLGRYPTFTHIDTGPRGRRWGKN